MAIKQDIQDHLLYALRTPMMPSEVPCEFIARDNKTLKRVVLYHFNVYVEDYAPFTIREAFEAWKESNIGSWCLKHAHEISYRQYHDIPIDSYNITIFGYMEEKHYTWFLLNK